jgi:hypothetical protein
VPPVSAEGFPETLEEAIALAGSAGTAGPRTCIIIYHLLRGAGPRGLSPIECWRELRRIAEEAGFGWRPPSYASVRNTFYVLRRLGLIELAGQEESSRPWLHPVTRYRLTARGERERALWLSPWRAYRSSGGRPAAPRARPPPPPPSLPPEVVEALRAGDPLGAVEAAVRAGLGDEEFVAIAREVERRGLAKVLLEQMARRFRIAVEELEGEDAETLVFSARYLLGG